MTRELLTPTQMAAADHAAIDAGTPGIDLMENAGQVVADSLQQLFPDARAVLVLCGRGNNGGDGFVVARLLDQAGISSHVWCVSGQPRVGSDAALAFSSLDASLLLETAPDWSAYDVIVDAVFGAGLNRDVDEQVAGLFACVNASGVPVLAVDLPSGVDGATGQVLGAAVHAHTTVTFFRFKPAHMLYPGRQICGDRVLCQIGIPDAVIARSGSVGVCNTPDLWRNDYPIPRSDGHKYNRGHCVTVSGALRFSGAARLASSAALRVGAGLVTLASPRDALGAHANQLTSIMVAEAEDAEALEALLKDSRLNCVALGFGLPPDAATRAKVLAVLNQGRATVLDAGAMTAFAEQPDELFEAIGSNPSDVVLTPHDGEFARVFATADAVASKIERTLAAAKHSGATLILKGPDTVVASPNGDVSVADNAPPWLATAGSGDVLAGIVAGLLTQGMPAFQAASAAVWLHGHAAELLGPALIASELEYGLKQAIQEVVHASNCGH